MNGMLRNCGCWLEVQPKSKSTLGSDAGAVKDR